MGIHALAIGPDERDDLNGLLATATAVGLTLPTIVSAQSLDQVMEARGLTQQDLLAAAKT